MACCGGEGPYGVSLSTACGYGDYKVCDNPDKYGSWDGFHPSEAAYKVIALAFCEGHTHNHLLLPPPVPVHSSLSSALLLNTRSSTIYSFVATFSC